MTPSPATTAALFVECQNGLLGENSVMRALAEGARPQIAEEARPGQFMQILYFVS